MISSISVFQKLISVGQRIKKCHINRKMCLLFIMLSKTTNYRKNVLPFEKAGEK